jgi:hypothetical protein
MPEGMTKEQLIQLLLAQLSGGQNPYPMASGNVMSPFNVAQNIAPQDLGQIQRAASIQAPEFSPQPMMTSDQGKALMGSARGLLDLLKKKPGVTFGAGNYIIPRTQIQSMPNLGFSSKFSGNLFGR